LRAIATPKIHSVVIVCVLIGAVTGALAAFAAGPARADQIDALSRTLENDRSEKARIAAGLALARRADPRSLGPFIRALSDQSPVVRGLAATALGHLGDVRAIPALERALSDDTESVRARARAALEKLRPGERSQVLEPTASPVPTRARFAPREPPLRRLHVVVNQMAGRTPAAHHLTARMRELVVSQLAAAPDVSLDGEGDNAHQFIVDGSITKLNRENNGPNLEVTCEVKITISNSRGSILSIVTGGATVQTSRVAYLSRALEASLEDDALDNAVRGAHENLYSFIVRQGGAK
jgi:hypothetical protein